MELSRKLESRGEEVPRKMPTAEREERRRHLAARLVGLEMEDENDPAHCLMDLAVGIYEDNCVKYIPWQKCPKRRAELSMPASSRGGVEVGFKRTAEGFLKEEARAPQVEADTSGALKIMNCLTRRGLALEIAGVMSFEKHRLIQNRLMASLQKEAPDSGYAPISMEQVRRADEYIFRRMGEECRSGVKPNRRGELPMNITVDEILREHDLSLILAHLPGLRGGGGRASGAPEPPKPKTGKLTKAEKKQKKKERDAAAAAKNRPQREAPVKEKERDRPKDRSSVKMPRDLIGCASKDEKGENLCFGYNLGTCTAAAPGNKCARGWHKCCTPGCLSSSHSHKACDKK